jgi:hypothetical protein
MEFSPTHTPVLAVGLHDSKDILYNIFNLVLHLQIERATLSDHDTVSITEFR